MEGRSRHLWRQYSCPLTRHHLGRTSGCILCNTSGHHPYKPCSQWTLIGAGVSCCSDTMREAENRRHLLKRSSATVPCCVSWNRFASIGLYHSRSKVPHSRSWLTGVTPSHKQLEGLRAQDLTQIHILPPNLRAVHAVSICGNCS